MIQAPALGLTTLYSWYHQSNSPAGCRGCTHGITDKSNISAGCGGCRYDGSPISSESLQVVCGGCAVIMVLPFRPTVLLVVWDVICMYVCMYVYIYIYIYIYIYMCVCVCVSVCVVCPWEFFRLRPEWPLENYRHSTNQIVKQKDAESAREELAGGRRAGEWHL